MAGGFDAVEIGVKNSLSSHKEKMSKTGDNKQLSTELRYYLMRWKQM